MSHLKPVPPPPLEEKIAELRAALAEPDPNLAVVPRNGIVLGLLAATYHAHPALGRSILDEIRLSPAHLQHRLEVGRDDTDSFRQGRALHRMLLEPLEFHRETAVWRGGDKVKNKGAWQAFKAEHDDKDIITVDELNTLTAMAVAFRRHKEGRILLESPMREVSAFCMRDGIACKARPDIADPITGTLIDVKTTSSSGPHEFMRDAWKYGYHRQAAWYLDVMSAATGVKYQHFLFGVVEKSAPHGVFFCEAPPAFVEAGRRENAANLALYRHCLETDHWPCYPEQRMLLQAPAWAREEV
jgi:hypothetical protein